MQFSTNKARICIIWHNRRNPLRPSGLRLSKNLQHFCNKSTKKRLKTRQITRDPDGRKWKEKNPRTVAAQGFSMVTRRGFEPRTHCLKGIKANSFRKIKTSSSLILNGFAILEFAISHLGLSRLLTKNNHKDRGQFCPRPNFTAYPASSSHYHKPCGSPLAKRPASHL